MDLLFTTASFLGFAFFIGLRHGIDLDHLAAISDIVSSQTSSRKGFFYSILYGIGHGVVILIFGSTVIFLGAYIPAGIDDFFRYIIGVTLVLLALYVLFSLIRYKSHFKMRSRWMILFSTVNYFRHKVFHYLKLEHDHPHFKEEQYGSVASFIVGMIHGVGVETPSQAIVFSILFGIEKGINAFLFLLFFIFGIFVTHVVVAFLCSKGYLKAKENYILYMVVGILTALFSLLVGISFLWG